MWSAVPSGSLPIFSEGGLARVFIEGGGFALGLFCIAVTNVLYRGLRQTLADVRSSEFPERRAIGFAFLCGSLVAFLIGHQVFGDPLVLFLTGLIAGETVGSRQLAGSNS